MYPEIVIEILCATYFGYRMFLYPGLMSLILRSFTIGAILEQKVVWRTGRLRNSVKVHMLRVQLTDFRGNFLATLWISMRWVTLVLLPEKKRQARLGDLDIFSLFQVVKILQTKGGTITLQILVFLNELDMVLALGFPACHLRRGLLGQWTPEAHEWAVVGSLEA